MAKQSKAGEAKKKAGKKPATAKKPAAKKPVEKPAATKKEAKKPAAAEKKKPAATKKPASAKKELKKKAAPAKKPAAAKKKAAEKKESPAATPEKKKKTIEKIMFHEKKELSEVEELKKKKPRFIRQELYRMKRLDDKWRSPRGTDSKKAEYKRGKGAVPAIGYKNPERIRGLHPYGYYPVLVHNTAELAAIDPEKQGAIIAASVGRKKRNEIIKSANERKITVLNPRKGEL